MSPIFPHLSGRTFELVELFFWPNMRQHDTGHRRKKVYLCDDSSVVLCSPVSFSLTCLTTILKKTPACTRLSLRDSVAEGQIVAGVCSANSPRKNNGVFDHLSLQQKLLQLTFPPRDLYHEFTTTRVHQIKSCCMGLNKGHNALELLK